MDSESSHRSGVGRVFRRLARGLRGARPPADRPPVLGVPAHRELMAQRHLPRDAAPTLPDGAAAADLAPTLDEDAVPTGDGATAWRPGHSGIRALLGAGAVVADRYVVTGVLGRGGMGLVYAARDVAAARPVAVKVAPAALLHERASVPGAPPPYARVYREHAAAQRAAHPHAARTLDVGVDAATGDGYVVYELVPGPSLREELERRGRVPPAEAAAVLVPVLRALGAAHRAGVVHRDVKPDNILLTEDAAGAPRPVLIDWSVALLDHAAPDARITAASVTLGTPAYMAPEAARNALAAGPAIDVWGAGVVLYELVTGARPFEAHSPVALLCRIATERAPAPAGVPAPVAAVVARALDPDPAARYATADAMADALLAAVAVPDPRVRARQRRRLAAVLVVAALWAGVALALQGAGPQPDAPRGRVDAAMAGISAAP